MSEAKYVCSPFARTTTRSLSSPYVVVRSHTAPSLRYMCPRSSSRSSVRCTRLGVPLWSSLSYCQWSKALTPKACRDLCISLTITFTAACPTSAGSREAASAKLVASRFT